jgi:CRP-like cAMP-binding protein/hydrogenase maturation factor
MNPLPGRITEVYNEGDNRIGVVEFDGKRHAIYLSLVPEAQVDDYVRFYAGFAIERTEGNEGQPGHQGPSAEGEKPNLTIEICRASRLLSELDPEQLLKLIPLTHNELFAAGEIVFHDGDKSRSLHLIASGDVALEEVSGTQPIQVQTLRQVQSLRAGDAMGWSALTPGGRTHFQARALSRVGTIAFSGEQLRAACEQDPAIGYALTKRLIELVTERLDAMRMKLAEKSKN